MRSTTGRWLLAGLVVFLLTIPAWAATITVTNTNDAGAGSLRQAIADAVSGDTINFAVTGTITLTSGELGIAKDLTINGPGAGQLTISGGNSSRIFNITSGTVAISGLTIADGAGVIDGGGVSIFGGTLTITDCTIKENTASSNGGGIYCSNGTRVTVTNCTLTDNTASKGGGICAATPSGTVADVTLTDCTISGNTGNSQAGGIYNDKSVFTINRCTVTENDGTQAGGGLYSYGTTTLTNCTLSSNRASFGGGIYNDRSIETLTNCTVSGNTAAGDGGAIYNYQSTTTLTNCTLNANSASTADSINIHTGTVIIANCIVVGSSVGTITDGGHNIQGANPNLGPLQDNGGPTFTHALLDGSPAIDAIPEGGDGYNGAPATDQRGENRPSPAAGNCDIGAYEVQAAVAADTPRPIFGGSSGCGANRAPVPNAGPDQVVCVGERVTLDGSASYDPDEGIPQNVIMGVISPQYVNQQRANLQFQWEVAVLYYAAGQPVLAIPNGADISASLQGFDSEIGSFIPNVPGIYQFDLFITDDHGDTVSDRILITCLPCHSADDQAVIESSFEHFIVSPNPFDDQVKFGFVGEGLAEVIKGIVFDLSGHRVWEGQVTDADELLWDGRCLDGRLAASAPYIYTIILIENGRMHTETGTVFIQR